MTETCGRTTRQGGEPCELPAGWGTDHPGEGACKHHGGASSGAPEDNDNAATHGAYSESFVSDFLTEAEIARVEDAQELLDTPEGAQSHAKLMAAIAVEQFRRTGDGRFLRRYESICDKFGIAPADELEVSGEGGGPLEVAINRTVTEHEHDGD
jgi:hypothetical protein